MTRGRGLRHPALGYGAAVVLVCFVLSQIAGAQCAAKIILDSGPLKGTVQSIATTELNANQEVVSRTEEEFDEKGRLVSRKVANGAGATISSTTYTYGRFGLLEATTESSDPQLSWTFKRNYATSGLVVESFAVNGAGELSVAYLRDSMNETPRSISRTFCFGPGHPKELNQQTFLLEYPRKGSETRVVADGAIVAKWWMERDKRGHVVRDDVGYMDLSFSKREFHADGTSFEHAFVSASQRQQFIWRNADGRTVKSETADVGGPIKTTEIAYNEAIRPVLMNEQSGNSTGVRTEYVYRDDDHGNWVEMTQWQGRVRKATTTRTISYFEQR